MIPTVQLFNISITSPSCAFFFGETTFCLIKCGLMGPFHSGCRPYGALPELFIRQVTATCPKPTWKHLLSSESITSVKLSISVLGQPAPSVSQGCHDKVPQTGRLEQQKFIVSVLETRSARSGCQQGRFLLRL